jgi:hypothetical protein
MLQLSKNQAINTIAIYPNIAIDSTVTTIRLSGSQDYDRSASYVDATIISNPENTPWVIAQFSGSLLPSASGLYTYDIYEVVPDFLIWNLTNTNWEATSQQWQDATTGGVIIGDKLTTERAWISGSDVPVFTQYVSPDENGAYTTYLG